MYAVEQLLDRALRHFHCRLKAWAYYSTRAPARSPGIPCQAVGEVVPLLLRLLPLMGVLQADAAK